MMFLNSVARPVVFGIIGDIGSIILPPKPPKPPKVDVPGGGKVDGPKPGDVSTPKSGDGGKTDYDQTYIDKQVGKFEGEGQVLGQKEPGSAPTTETTLTPEQVEYRDAQQKKWQAEQDAKKRDQLFAQPTSGHIDGKTPEPFSQSGLEESVETVLKAGKEGRALPLQIRNMVKTALINAPITALFAAPATLASSVAYEYLKPKINPPATPATEQHVMESQLVENAQRNVFMLMNTYAALGSQKGIEPSVEWLSKTNDERMDYLDEMLNFLEVEFAKLAGKDGPESQPPKLGAQADDIKGRAIGMQTRIAYLKGLLDVIKSKQQ
jgi:hypothetical protein